MRVLVIGAGLYGRYCADLMKRHGHHAAIVAEDESLEFDQSDSNTASLVNQARIHNGYHYPRSLATAMESSKNYQRFKKDFAEAVIDFDQFYAIPKRGSLTSAKQFKSFCDRLNVKCEETRLSMITDAVDKIYETDEVAIDTRMMMQIASKKFKYDAFYHGRVIALEPNYSEKVFLNEHQRPTLYNWTVKMKESSGQTVYLPGSYDLIINCTYAGLNRIEKLAKVTETATRFELCEIVIFRDTENVLNNRGITFMDGPFVSFMPWSQDDQYSLTSVCHTPHESAKSFSRFLDVRVTQSRRAFMIAQLKKFVKSEVVDKLTFEDSKFVIKTISNKADLDDSRLVEVNYDKHKRFLSVLSGKLDAIYEIEEKLKLLEVL